MRATFRRSKRSPRQLRGASAPDHRGHAPESATTTSGTKAFKSELVEVLVVVLARRSGVAAASWMKPCIVGGSVAHNGHEEGSTGLSRRVSRTGPSGSHSHPSAFAGGSSSFVSFCGAPGEPRVGPDLGSRAQRSRGRHRRQRDARRSRRANGLREEPASPVDERAEDGLPPKDAGKQAARIEQVPFSIAADFPPTARSYSTPYVCQAGCA